MFNQLSLSKAQGLVLTLDSPAMHALKYDLEIQGCAVDMLPFLQVKALSDSSILNQHAQQLEQYTLVVFVSPFAIQMFMPYVQNWPMQTRIAVMGCTSYSLLKNAFELAGVPIIYPQDREQQGSEALLAKLAQENLQDKKVLIICADHGRELLEQGLQKQGALVDKLVAYQRVPAVINEVFIDHVKKYCALKAWWLISSSEVLNMLNNLRQTIASANISVTECRLLLTQERIFNLAREYGFNHVGRVEPNAKIILTQLHGT